MIIIMLRLHADTVEVREVVFCCHIISFIDILYSALFMHIISYLSLNYCYFTDHIIVRDSIMTFWARVCETGESWLSEVENLILSDSVGSGCTPQRDIDYAFVSLLYRLGWKEPLWSLYTPVSAVDVIEGWIFPGHGSCPKYLYLEMDLLHRARMAFLGTGWLRSVICIYSGMDLP